MCLGGGKGLKALVYHQYGKPDVLGVEDAPGPVPGTGEVLIRMKACSLNAWDWDMLRGSLFARLDAPTRPKRRILGADLAGIVEAVGPQVRRLKIGDEVFGDVSSSHWGGLAEFAVAPEYLLARKSERVSFVQAAAIPQAGLLAIQGLRHKGMVMSGDKVLINGAGGGMGSFAVQLAKRAGAVVTAVDRASKLDFMQRLGADHTLDFEQVDFTSTGETYDLIVDPVANRPMSHYARALTPRGRMVLVGGTMRAILGTLTTGALIARRSEKWLGIVPLAPVLDDLNELQELCAGGKVVPAIGGKFTLETAHEAFAQLGAGEALGKLVVEIER